MDVTVAVESEPGVSPRRDMYSVAESDFELNGQSK